MGNILPFVLRLVPNWLADRLDDLFHAPFWKLLTGVVIVALSLAAFSALPAGARDKAKLIVVFAALAIAALDYFRPPGAAFPFG